MTLAMVVVCGYPASGKTTLARDLACRLAFPLIAKDDIKETLGDVLGAGDSEWSHKLGRATYAVMFKAASSILGAGVSLVLESNFQAEFSADLRRLQAEHDPWVVRVALTADPDVLLRRYRERAEAGERHPVHLDHEYLARMEEIVSVPYEPPDLPGPLVEVDGETWDPAEVLGHVEAALASTDRDRS